MPTMTWPTRPGRRVTEGLLPPPPPVCFSWRRVPTPLRGRLGGRLRRPGPPRWERCARRRPWTAPLEWSPWRQRGSGRAKGPPARRGPGTRRRGAVVTQSSRGGLLLSRCCRRRSLHEERLARQLVKEQPNPTRRTWGVRSSRGGWGRRAGAWGRRRRLPWAEHAAAARPARSRTVSTSALFVKEELGYSGENPDEYLRPTDSRAAAASRSMSFREPTRTALRGLTAA